VEYVITDAKRIKALYLATEGADRFGVITDQNAVIDMFSYLEGLRESAVTNMFGASPYLAKQFKIQKEFADMVLVGWMDTYSE
jgi:hypothetical protein